MKVEREGGAISLELSQALGTISTGAAQTAAELALVRLTAELRECEARRGPLLYTVRCHEAWHRDRCAWASAGRLSGPAAALALARASVLSSEISWKSRWGKTLAEGGTYAVGAVGAIAIAVMSAFVCRLLGLGVCALLGLTSLAGLFGLVVAGGVAGFAIEASLSTSKLRAEEEKLNLLLSEHQRAVDNQAYLPTSAHQLQTARDLLAPVEAEWQRLQADIARNRAIVTSR